MRTALLALSLTAFACQKQAAPEPPVRSVSDPSTELPDRPWPNQLAELADHLEHVHFDTDSAALSARAEMRLNKAARILIANPDVRIVAMGHADARGDKVHNRRLARDRAEAVVRYLASQGVAADRLIARSAGEAVPEIDRDTPRAYSQNRRVELYVVWQPEQPTPSNDAEADAESESTWVPEPIF